MDLNSHVVSCMISDGSNRLEHILNDFDVPEYAHPCWGMNHTLTTLVHLAVDLQAPQCLQCVVVFFKKKGYRVNQLDTQGVTPLYLLADTKLRMMKHVYVNLYMAHILICNGADVNISSTEIPPPLYAAASRNNKKLVILLCQRGANASLTYRGRTPLSISATTANLSTVSFLSNVTDIRTEKVCSLPFIIRNNLFHSSMIKLLDDQFDALPLIKIALARDDVNVLKAFSHFNFKMPDQLKEFRQALFNLRGNLWFQQPVFDYIGLFNTRTLNARKTILLATWVCDNFDRVKAHMVDTTTMNQCLMFMHSKICRRYVANIYSDCLNLYTIQSRLNTDTVMHIRSFLCMSWTRSLFF